MKKCYSLAIFIACALLCSCGKNKTKQEMETKQEVTIEESTSETTIITTKKEPEPTTKKEPVPAYMGTVTQQYDDANKQHIFFWQFQDKDKNVIKAKATINITIKNNNDEEVFNRDFEVDENDYNTWSNKLSSSSQVLGSITVNDSEIAEGSVTMGVATLTTKTSFGGFDPISISVSDLPQKGVNINLPALPAYSNYYGFREDIDTTMMVSDISYEYDRRLKIKLTAQMTYNADGESARDFGKVGYKITDGNGMVVDSGTALFDPLSVGESQIKEITVFDAKPGDDLTLTIIDAD